MKVKGKTTKQGRDQRIAAEAVGVRLVLEEERGKGTQDSLLTMEYVYGKREFLVQWELFKTRS